jgi:hypothetical protein
VKCLLKAEINVLRPREEMWRLKGRCVDGHDT